MSASEELHLAQTLRREHVKGYSRGGQYVRTYFRNVMREALRSLGHMNVGDTRKIHGQSVTKVGPDQYLHGGSRAPKYGSDVARDIANSLNDTHLPGSERAGQKELRRAFDIQSQYRIPAEPDTGDNKAGSGKVTTKPKYAAPTGPIREAPDLRDHVPGLGAVKAGDTGVPISRIPVGSTVRIRGKLRKVGKPVKNDDGSWSFRYWDGVQWDYVQAETKFDVASVPEKATKPPKGPQASPMSDKELVSELNRARRYGLKTHANNLQKELDKRDKAKAGATAKPSPKTAAGVNRGDKVQVSYGGKAVPATVTGWTRDGKQYYVRFDSKQGRKTRALVPAADINNKYKAEFTPQAKKLEPTVPTPAASAKDVPLKGLSDKDLLSRIQLLDSKYASAARSMYTGGHMGGGGALRKSSPEKVAEAEANMKKIAGELQRARDERAARARGVKARAFKVEAYTSGANQEFEVRAGKTVLGTVYQTSSHTHVNAPGGQRIEHTWRIKYTGDGTNRIIARSDIVGNKSDGVRQLEAIHRGERPNPNVSAKRVAAAGQDKLAGKLEIDAMRKSAPAPAPSAGPKYKVGDRIHATGRFGAAEQGITGEITEYNASTGSYTVKLDSPALFSNGERTSIAHVSEKQISRAAAPAPAAPLPEIPRDTNLHPRGEDDPGIEYEWDAIESDLRKAAKYHGVTRIPLTDDVFDQHEEASRVMSRGPSGATEEQLKHAAGILLNPYQDEYDTGDADFGRGADRRQLLADVLRELNKRSRSGRAPAQESGGVNPISGLPGKEDPYYPTFPDPMPGTSFDQGKQLGKKLADRFDADVAEQLLASLRANPSADPSHQEFQAALYESLRDNMKPKLPSDVRDNTVTLRFLKKQLQQELMSAPEGTAQQVIRGQLVAINSQLATKEGKQISPAVFDRLARQVLPKMGDEQAYPVRGAGSIRRRGNTFLIYDTENNLIGQVPITEPERAARMVLEAKRGALRLQRQKRMRKKGVKIYTVENAPPLKKGRVKT